jgi:Ribosomal protein S3, C-terminal domain
MLKNSNSISSWSQHTFKRAYAVDLDKVAYPDLAKYLNSHSNFQINAHQYFDFERRIFRSAFKSELCTNFPALSKLQACHVFFNYEQHKKNIDPTSFIYKSLVKPKVNISLSQPGDPTMGALPVSVLKLKQWPRFEFRNFSVHKTSTTSQFDPKDCSKHLYITKWQSANIMHAHWVLQDLVEQLNTRRSPRGIINALVRNAGTFLRSMGSVSPVLGLRVVATGRLGSQKKGMAQQIIKSVGKVPLSSLRQKIDYAQGFVSTRRGLIGLKVWVCYK